ncbi:TIGR02206 family membrane protein [Metabacillus sp. HB246100]
MHLFTPETDDVFILFSIEHIFTLGIFLAVIMGIVLFRKRLRDPKVNQIARYVLFSTLLVSEISLHIWLVWYDSWSYVHSLPLHLSSITLVLTAILLLTKKFSLFEFTFFAGVGSALQAMLTPDISSYVFPHYRYIHFFISHGGTVIANLFMVFVNGYRPNFCSVWKAFFWLNGYAALIYVINRFIGGNYMYVVRKPVNPTMIDYFGPWPWYMIPLELVAISTFLFLYLPFFLYKKWEEK